MRLKITHVTTYSYDHPDAYALQQLRLIPRTGHGQHVLDWQTTITGATRQLGYDDEFGNHVELLLIEPDTTRVEIVSEGLVEIEDRAGVVGQQKNCAPLWLFEAATPFTAPGKALRQLAGKLKPKPDETGLERAHRLCAKVAKLMTFTPGHTASHTTAEEALKDGKGVCQDYAHIMIAVARMIGWPARYVSGYLYMEDVEDQDASHAWCEIWIEGLGWIGFDAANEICPDDRYVRVAIGRDYRDAAPIHGIRHGSGREDLHVALKVQAQTDQ
ncbi:putative protein involved in cytokinesis, contains TGc (transglutaminase/protease-like) domain [Thalassovita gelatinovora]|uniref:Transglutaminase-like domain-containing protein n=1 Tax=Thalassovita gelatinovora TaxID=53501 RepID=A0A0P1FBW2_THAGE|nr:transglutaminase family protein [Thalassovita gelatinovora]QIZ80023.1 transglutaminase family protein [Thalassovita gelatinovora]CUH65719.1 putative protein involved in cytokinesis, contains TGc (transglutaminase/protease-like) domain [Thalassovita gelatinovora]SER04498.1 Transglutaminase-like enzyme, putative cysteine protease [Thalassovita gelatinovora]